MPKATPVLVKLAGKWYRWSQRSWIWPPWVMPLPENLEIPWACVMVTTQAGLAREKQSWTWGLTKMTWNWIYDILLYVYLFVLCIISNLNFPDCLNAFKSRFLKIVHDTSDFGTVSSSFKLSHSSQDLESEKLEKVDFWILWQCSWLPYLSTLTLEECFKARHDFKAMLLFDVCFRYFRTQLVKIVNSI